MKFKSNVYTQVSGSVGGTTYGHNRGGMYARGRGLPTNPNSPAQQAVRQAFGTSSAAWAALTEAQRTGWSTYAAGTPTTNALGDPLTLTGQQMFNRVNAIGSQPGGFTFADAPVTLGLSVLGTSGIVIDTVGQDVHGDVAAAEWAAALNGRLYVYYSPVVKATVNYYKGPFQYVGSDAGAVIPVVLFTVEPLVQYGPNAGDDVNTPIGEARFVRLQAIDAEGRPSQSVTYKIIGT